MAPLKFEEHIKDKLEQRKLQPSADAWQKLSGQLSDDASKKNTKAFWWIGIAASIVGVLLVVTIMLNSGNENSLPTLVDTEKVDTIIKDEIHIDLNSENEKKPETILNSKAEEKQQKSNTTEQSKIKKSSLLKQKIEKEQTKLVPAKTNEAVASYEVKAIEINEIKELTSQEKAIETVVLEMQKLQEQNKSSIDSELDALLNEAQQEIAMDKLYKEAIKSVDAEALLQGVEQDMDLSFRDRVFKALKESYKTVKTAVAERNN